MKFKKIKHNPKESKNISDIDSIIESVTKYKRGTLKIISHSKMKILLQLT